MKRLILSILIPLLTLSSWGQDVIGSIEQDGVIYRLYSSYFATVVGTKSKKITGSISIPSEIYNSNDGQSYDVVSIEDGAFNFCSALTSITIPESVVSINDSAFSNCSGLTNITFPESLRIIGNRAFYNCSGLKSIIIPESVKLIGNNAFFNINLQYIGVYWTSFSGVNILTDFNGYTYSNAVVDFPQTCAALYKSKLPWCLFDCISSLSLASGISLNENSLTLTSAGQTTTLQATVSPSNASFKNVTWTSSNPLVATVDSNGVVTAVSNGTATITVTTADGTNKTATCAVTVNIPVKATGVSLNQTSLTLTSAGETATLLASVSPYNASNKNVTWISSNPSVATVNSNGVVSAVANGTTTITVITTDGSSKTATCTVIVKNLPILASDVTLDQTSLTLTSVGETAILLATVSPDSTTDKTVIWTSSNTDVVTVSDYHELIIGSDTFKVGRVKAVANGTATVTVTTADGSNKTATCIVTVKNILATGVTLNRTSLTLVKGQTSTLQATVSPSNASNKNVTWISSNPSVATVNSNGVVRAVANGTATITVKTTDGSNKSATCTVIVSDATSDIITYIGDPIKSVNEINATSYYLLTSVGRHGSDGKYLYEDSSNNLYFEEVKVGHSSNAAFQFEPVGTNKYRIRTITGNYLPIRRVKGWFTSSQDNPETFLIEPIDGVKEQFTLTGVQSGLYLDADDSSVSMWNSKSAANRNGAYRIVNCNLTPSEQDVLNKELQECYDEAKKQYLFSLSFEGSEDGQFVVGDGLLTSESQILVVPADPSENNPKGLFDGVFDGKSFIHTSWHSNVQGTEPHYIQMELSEPVQKLVLKYATRSNASTPDIPYSVTMYGTNNANLLSTNTKKVPCNQWDNLGEYTLNWQYPLLDADGKVLTVSSRSNIRQLIPDGEGAGITNFAFPATYRYVRMAVNKTIQHELSKSKRTNGDGFDYWYISELRAYSGKVDSSVPQTITDRLTECMNKAQQELSEGAATQQTITDLRDALNAFVEATTGINTIQSAYPQNTDQSVYTLQGQRVTNTRNLRPGIYIIGGKKVLIK